MDSSPRGDEPTAPRRCTSSSRTRSLARGACIAIGKSRLALLVSVTMTGSWEVTLPRTQRAQCGGGSRCRLRPSHCASGTRPRGMGIQSSSSRLDVREVQGRQVARQCARCRRGCRFQALVAPREARRSVRILMSVMQQTLAFNDFSIVLKVL